VPGPGQGELLTPTGAALLTEYATFERPAMTVKAVGYGFGTKVGERLTVDSGRERDQVVLLACNLDDATGELLGYVMQCLFEAGALDVWFTPIQMKKNRPATEISVLARPEDADAMAALLLRETPTLGVRRQAFPRYCAERQMQQVETPWGTVRVKVKKVAGMVVAASPEYDDCARLAAESGVPLAEVMDAARRAAEQD